MSEETVEQAPKEEQTNDEEQSAPARVPEDNTPIVLVTGASGFIASHVIKILLEEGNYRVRGTVRDATNESKTKLIRDLVPNAAKPIELVSADLTNEGSWGEVVKGCTYVLHLASPFYVAKAKNEDIVIRPAVEGTLNILKACAAEVERSGLLKRVVVMSSIAAVSSGMGGDSNKVHTEEDWSDETILPAYEKSKYRAERAGWDYMEKLDPSKTFELSVVCPAVVIGPVLNSAAGSSTSMNVIVSLLANKFPGIPNVNFPIVDVRDVAKGTIAAMEKPEAANRRYLLANENPIPCGEISSMMAEEFIPQGYKITTKPFNRALLWIASIFSSEAKTIRNYEGTTMKYNISRMTGELGVSPYPFKATILDACYSLIDHGIVAKTPKYLGHPDARPPPEEPKEEETITEEPKAEETATEEPKAEETATEEPKTEETATEEPKTEETATKEPKTEETATKEPKTEETATEEPKTEEMATEEPKTEETATKEPKTEETAPEEPKAEETATEEPKAKETATEEPKEETATEEPKEEETATEEPKEEETATEEPKEETATEKPKEEETATEEPKEETATEEPKEEETATEEPKEEETATEEPKTEETSTDEH